MDRIYYVSFAIEGVGTSTVVASSEDEAIKKFNNGEYLEAPECDEWEINTKPHKGGYVGAQEGEEYNE